MDVALVDAAIEALSFRGWSPTEAKMHVTNVAGLYAVRGTADVWEELDLGPPPDDRPLYVGKAERSLGGRDLNTHFATGRTGSSTLRRSLSACLREQLSLRACPRNTEKPDGSANFALELDGDERLTTWMHDSLRLSVWESPDGCALGVVETAVLVRLEPPLNIDKIVSRWRSKLKERRAALVTESRTWQST